MKGVHPGDIQADIIAEGRIAVVIEVVIEIEAEVKAKVEVEVEPIFEAEAEAEIEAIVDIGGTINVVAEDNNSSS